MVVGMYRVLITTISLKQLYNNIIRYMYIANMTAVGGWCIKIMGSYICIYIYKKIIIIMIIFFMTF
jgi:hypothetical protein